MSDNYLRINAPTQGKNPRYFTTYAKQLQDLGYDPITVPYGEKNPGKNVWQSHDYQGAIESTRKKASGIGHRTKAAPAIDVDVRDAGIANQLAVWLDNKGFKSFRYGQRPKFACIARWPDAPQVKRTSAVFDNNDSEDKIEILGDGQQLILLNEHPSGNHYEWTNGIIPVADCPVLTDALVDELFDFYEDLASSSYMRKKDRSSPPSTERKRDVQKPMDDHEIEGILKDIDPDVEYDTWFRVGAAIYHHGGSFELFNDWSAQGEKYPGRQALEKKWSSFPTSGDKASLFSISIEQAFQAIEAVIDIATAKWNEYLAHLDAVYRKTVAQAQLHMDDFQSLIANIKPPRWLIKGVVEEEALCLFYGPSGSYKSFNVLDMGLAIASNRNWQGRKTAHGPVFFFAGEGLAGIQKRVKSWAKFHGEINAMFHRAKEPLRLGEKELVQKWVDIIRARYPNEPPKVIIIDTLHSSMRGLDENSAKDMSTIFEAAKEVIRILRCSVWVVHHTGKKGLDPRGSSSIEQGVDCRYYVSSPTRNHSQMVCYKMKDAEIPEEPLDIIYQDVQLGVDEDGDPFGSLVAMPEATSIVEGFIVGKGFKPDSMTGHAIAVLWDHGAEINSDGWSELTRARAEGTDNAKRQQFHKAKAKLLKKGIITTKKGGNGEVTILVGVTPHVTPQVEGVTE
jgi:hypothetical protein